VVREAKGEGLKIAREIESKHLYDVRSVPQRQGFAMEAFTAVFKMCLCIAPADMMISLPFMAVASNETHVYASEFCSPYASINQSFCMLHRIPIQ
jgi:hypothetical protein